MEDLDMTPFGGVYLRRRVLVTGHTGFKGSWLTYWLRELGADVAGLARDPDTSPSHWHLLEMQEVADYRVDLRDAEAVSAVLRKHRPELVFHLAAQPLVRRSYREPVATFESNVMGLINLLEAVRNCDSVRVLVNATTDKVYAEQPETSGYREHDPLGASDPYSTSKACAELISECYRKSFFSDGSPRFATARAGNVIGGGDWAEDRLVPDLVRAAKSGTALAIRNPRAIRPWQHVLEPLSGYLSLAQRLWEYPTAEGAWNFGPGSDGEISVHALALQLGKHWPTLRIEHDSTSQLHESRVLRLDASKAQRELGWKPVWDINTALARTAAWHLRFDHSRQLLTGDDLDAYVRDARRAGLHWAR